MLRWIETCLPIIDQSPDRHERTRHTGFHRMSPTRSQSFSVRELATRVAVTLGALAIYRLGAALPLPGLDAERLYESGLVNAERISIFALGVMPMLNALLLVEMARLISDRFDDWGGATLANARRINHWALVGALLLAALQAYGVAVAFEGITGAVDDPGPEFRLAVVATLVGGTALLAWLTALISWYGVGSGFWILLLAPWLAGLPSAIARQIEFVRMGMLSQAGSVSILAYALFAVAGIAALGLVLARRGMPLERMLIWPLYIGTVLANFLLVIPWLLPDGPLQDTASTFLSPGAPLHIAALAVAIIAVSLAQSQRVEPPLPKHLPDVFAADGAAANSSSATPVDPAAATPVAALTALALAAVAVVPQLLKAWLNVPIPIDGIQITAAVGITLGVKSLLSGPRA
jgi:preprotein translocase subunit SecY